MWDLPRPELEPVFPALAGRFLTTASPGKPPGLHFFLKLGFLFQAHAVVGKIQFHEAVGQKPIFFLANN